MPERVIFVFPGFGEAKMTTEKTTLTNTFTTLDHFKGQGRNSIAKIDIRLLKEVEENDRNKN